MARGESPLRVFRLLGKTQNRSSSLSREPSSLRLLALCLLSGIVLTSGALAVPWLMDRWNRKPAAAPLERFFRPGTPMPDFTLPLAVGEGEVSLARLRSDGKPVVLVFASFTCSVFHGHLEQVEEIFHKYQDRAHFLFINISEAGHFIDGYQYLLPGQSNTDAATAKRCDAVQRAAKTAGLTLPLVVDADGGVESAYRAWPLRLMVLDPQGCVALDLGVGTNGAWDLDRLAGWLRRHPNAKNAAGAS